MATRQRHGRWYGDACGTAFAMELVGERWSLLIVRELLLGACRFSDLRAVLGTISAKTLTERLESLIDAGVVLRRVLPAPSRAQVYELTRWGYAAEPMIQEAGRWAAQSSGHDPTLPLSPVAFMISLRTMVDKRAVGKLKAKTIGFEIGRDSFIDEPAVVALPIRRRTETDRADATLFAPSAGPLAALFYRKLSSNDAGVRIEGDRAVAQRFVDLFALPPKLA